MSSFGGTLFMLQLGGWCPCLEKDEDKTARQALAHINAACQRVTWIKDPARKTSAKALFGSLFNKSESDVSDTTTEARLRIQDDLEGTPELFCAPNKSSIQLNIAFRRVNRVTLDDSAIVLLARPPPDDRKASPKELIRFVALQPDGAPIVDDARNMLVHHFSVLIEWERQRRKALGYDDDEDGDEEDQPNFIAARAKKAAHFAKREIELQQTKRQREERKAKLVKESGGLKYTALAMANRGEAA